MEILLISQVGVEIQNMNKQPEAKIVDGFYFSGS